MKKIGALVLALVMVLAMSMTAFAGTTDISDGGITSNGDRTTDTFDALNNTVSINKGIVFINDDPTNVYEPNITYTYTIDEVDVDGGDITVTDEHPVTPAHKAVVYDTIGLTGYVTNADNQATVTFADGNAFVGATAAGTQVTKPFTFTFVPSAFPHAGIYRFMITESVGTSAREIAGIVSNGTYSATRYLDVYVRNVSGTPGTYEIYGYVLFEADSENTDITGSTTKSNGWVNTAASGTPTDVDVYTTYNAYVQKHVSGSLGDQTNAFPFKISLDNTGTYDNGGTPTNLGRNTKIRVAATDATKATVSNGTTTWTGTSDAQISNAYIALNGETDVTVTGTIKHAGEIGFYGLPVDSRITVVDETNNTYDVYTASATVANGTGSAATKNIDYKAASTDTDYTTNVASAPLNSTGHAKLNAIETFTAKKVIDFTNTIAEISPTGVVLRIAPYALMLGAGVVLFIILKVRKNKAVEEA